MGHKVSVIFATQSCWEQEFHLPYHQMPGWECEPELDTACGRLWAVREHTAMGHHYLKPIFAC